MRRTYTPKELIKEIYTFLLAFVLTCKAPIRYLDYNGNPFLASMLSRFSLYGVFFLAICVIITRKDYIKYALYTLLFFVFLYLYQFLVVQPSQLNQYWPNFFIQGLAGCFCGIALSEPKSLIRYAGGISLVYGVLLIPEPITHYFLAYSSMSLGYTMAPLTIWLILFWYYSKRYKKVIATVAILLGIMTIAFTSRGCGLSVVAAYIIVRILDAKRRKESLYKPLFIISSAAVVIFLFIQELAEFFSLRTNIELLKGSTLNKIMDGMVSSDNGRAQLMQMAISLYKENWFLGVGMGEDREILGYVFPHNIIIEILLHFGLLMSVLILVCYWKTVANSFRKIMRSELAVIIPVLCCIYWLRLLFSDSYLSNSFGLMLIFGFSLQIICKYKTGDFDE